MKKVAKLFLGIFVSSTLLFTSCDESTPVADPGEAPQIPPVSSFLMNFDFVNANSGRVATSNNWTYAALNVGFWNLALTTTFAVPVASFAEAFNHEPTFDASLPGWVWQYDYAHDGGQYLARLEAQVTSTTVEWDMFISRTDGFEDFNWYSGASLLDGSSGSWILNKEVNDPRPFIEVKWVKNTDDIVSNIGYTNIEEGSDENGNFIFYQVTNEADLDRSYDLYDKSDDNLIEIEWNSSDKSGRVRDLVYFQETDYQCWDSSLDDASCE